ncbi:hypothetical protein RN001_001989 [Aquatica leii]|uniref:Uncharacterized protein n=1 Tax=Aquatica leii TaxID=1421715 RepID=A0AAN7SR32_9COLE|nr:hypothetical protein RN001_001989 [Aquatica leii]
MRSTCITKKRGKASKAQKSRRVRESVINIIKNGQHISEDAHIPYFENLPEENLPELEIEHQASLLQSSLTLEGNRIVNINHFLSEMKKIVYHDRTCTCGQMKLKKEIRRGIVSIFHYKCDVCDKLLQISSHCTSDNAIESLV